MATPNPPRSPHDPDFSCHPLLSPWYVSLSRKRGPQKDTLTKYFRDGIDEYRLCVPLNVKVYIVRSVRAISSYNILQLFRWEANLLSSPWFTSNNSWSQEQFGHGSKHIKIIQNPATLFVASIYKLRECYLMFIWHPLPVPRLVVCSTSPRKYLIVCQRAPNVSLPTVSTFIHHLAYLLGGGLSPTQVRVRSNNVGSWYIIIHHDTSWYVIIHYDTSWYFI
jgi:hypothetical protein